MKTKKYLNTLTKTFLICEYIEKQKSLNEIAKETNICPTSIYDYIKFHNILRRNAGEGSSINQRKNPRGGEKSSLL